MALYNHIDLMDFRLVEVNPKETKPRKYQVTIKEIYEKTVEIMADSPQEAGAKVKTEWQNREFGSISMSKNLADLQFIAIPEEDN